MNIFSPLVWCNAKEKEDIPEVDTIWVVKTCVAIIRYTGIRQKKYVRILECNIVGTLRK